MTEQEDIPEEIVTMHKDVIDIVTICVMRSQKLT